MMKLINYRLIIEKSQIRKQFFLIELLFKCAPSIVRFWASRRLIGLSIGFESVSKTNKIKHYF